jgi:hypothetical protein
VSPARITVEDETVLLRDYTQEFADIAGVIHRAVSAWPPAKSILSQWKMSKRPCAKRGFSTARDTLIRDVYPHPFRMKEVEEYGTGNCEMV